MKIILSEISTKLPTILVILFFVVAKENVLIESSFITNNPLQKKEKKKRKRKMLEKVQGSLLKWLEKKLDGNYTGML